jgi:hypothetical protein
MRIGLSIFLLALGAILAFAVQDVIPGVDLTMIGYILMAAGVVALIVSLVVGMPRGGRRVTESRTLRDQGTGETITRNETHDDR